MTDLEKLAREHASKMAAELEDGIRLGIREGGGGDIAVNGRMVAYLERELVHAYKQGRIEGLEEAITAVQRECAACGTPRGTTLPPVLSHDNCWLCGDEVAAIRTRIHELRSTDPTQQPRQATKER